MATVLTLTPQHLLTVTEIWQKLGILTVKDRQTGALFIRKGGDASNPADSLGNPIAKPYGQKYAPTVKHYRDGTPILDENRLHERVIQIRPGGVHFPQGIPVGVTLHHQRKTLRDFGGDDDFKMIGGQDDIIKHEWDRVRTFAQFGRDRQTDEERATEERRNDALRAKRVLSDLDPTSALATALAPLLAALAQGKPIPGVVGAQSAAAQDDGPRVPVLTREAGADAEEEALVR